MGNCGDRTLSVTGVETGAVETAGGAEAGDVFGTAEQPAITPAAISAAAVRPIRLTPFMEYRSCVLTWDGTGSAGNIGPACWRETGQDVRADAPSGPPAHPVVE